MQILDIADAKNQIFGYKSSSLLIIKLCYRPKNVIFVARARTVEPQTLQHDP